MSADVVSPSLGVGHNVGEVEETLALDGYKDARAAIRLIQCSKCSLPFRAPVTLPCGHSICRECLPPSHVRERITYPPRKSRSEGITCPFEDCGKIHPLEECSSNVVLYNIVHAVAEQVAKQLSLEKQPCETSVEEVITALDDETLEITSEKTAQNVEESNAIEVTEEEVVRSEKLDGSKSERTDTEDTETARIVQAGKNEPNSHSRTLQGGRLSATYSFAQMGELRYSSEVTYKDFLEVDGKSDIEMLEQVKEIAYKELECRVCYCLMNDPITTPCGHSFCRTCLERVLDHSKLCAVCRRTLPSPAALPRQPSDSYLSAILTSFWPEEVSLRARAIESEQQILLEGSDVPLFVCTIGFPQMPTLLHIFEPRYRLMVRRALESDRCFGMLMYNERGLPQGSLGRTDFMEMGVLLHIDHYQSLEDGRYLIFCSGVSRFRVLSHDIRDGYVVGRIQKVEDISLAEEERIEAEETSVAPVEATETPPDLDRLSTQQLLDIGTAFVQRAREQSESWLSGRIIEVYGGPPNDPAIFPYWFASILPLQEAEKYKLLPTTSVRERLKITAGWIRVIEAQRWYFELPNEIRLMYRDEFFRRVGSNYWMSN